MEEKQYASLTVSTDYLQHWFHSTDDIEPLQTTEYDHMSDESHLLDGLSEERVMTELAAPPEPDSHIQPDSYLDSDSQPLPDIHPQPDSEPAPEQAPRKGKRGRPPGKSSKSKQMLGEVKAKGQRKMDRFNGMSVAEVMAKTLPDILTYNLDILIIGINPGLMSAYKGRHYPNPGNHFWKCLFLSGLTDAQLNHMHDQSLPEKYGIGFTNMVERTTPGSKDLSSKEFREGGRLLVEKLKKYKPLIAVFNGKCIYDIFSKEIFGIKAKNLQFGIQPHKIPETETVCYLMPSSSARCAQFPRAQDKVHFYIKLKELRDQLKGVVHSQEVQELEYSFDVGLAKEDAKRISIKEEQHDPKYEAAYGHAGGEQDPETSNSHCDFSFAEACGGLEMAVKEDSLSEAMGWISEDQWMMHSFADQIPDIGGTSTQPQLWAKST
ncbi:G/T mismatch-specific thymine DNA glycosylase-like [Conger conger]|uniref:G/T mismatch-specific thymine DNA glycosylase-like n=1 Tax=Conger conger TaxID=82655 RepID=UPI002A59AB02|nr:G/T mismatch-specific thymine DNA glycosylase-like [Conger conger]XP_061108838.1 G/T mismatch-specific thymine DNA glycosylase-like [Conger conger]